MEHWETMKLHGWTDIAEVDIMDATICWNVSNPEMGYSP